MNIRKTFCDAEPGALAFNTCCVLAMIATGYFVGLKVYLIFLGGTIALIATMFAIGYGLYTAIKWAQSRCRDTSERVTLRDRVDQDIKQNDG